MEKRKNGIEKGKKLEEKGVNPHSKGDDLAIIEYFKLKDSKKVNIRKTTGRIRETKK